MTVSHAQKMALIRAASLLGRFDRVLSDHEGDLTRTCVERFRDRGERMTFTDNEWRVVEEAVGAMAAARDDAARIQAVFSADITAGVVS